MSNNLPETKQEDALDKMSSFPTPWCRPTYTSPSITGFEYVFKFNGKLIIKILFETEQLSAIFCLLIEILNN